MAIPHPTIKITSVMGRLPIDFNNALLFLGKEAIEKGKLSIYSGPNLRYYTSKEQVIGLVIEKWGSIYQLYGNRTLNCHNKHEIREKRGGVTVKTGRVCRVIKDEIEFALPDGKIVQAEYLLVREDYTNPIVK